MSRSHKQKSKKAKRPKGEGRSKQGSQLSTWEMQWPLAKEKPIVAKAIEDVEVGKTESQLCPYDENLLERARTQWQFGDWESLAQISRDTLQHHPDRAKLALLAAAGHLQQGDSSAARQFTRLAQDWGCNVKLISQILISGVHNTLGRASVINCNKSRALEHFQSAISVGSPTCEVRLIAQARITSQVDLVRLMMPNAWVCSVDHSEPVKKSVSSPELEKNTSTLSHMDRVRPITVGFQTDSIASLGPLDNYFINSFYQSRETYCHRDPAPEDKWQLEVYLHALALMIKNNLKTIADYGCGTGFKLITYLGKYSTIGYELDVNLVKLRELYPKRDWRISDFDSKELIDVDVLICADVIEHLVDPDKILKYFAKQSFKYLILSTPERELLYPKANDWGGPPKNPSHLREWNFLEFAAYIGHYFKVIDHRVTNLEQATQMIICTKR